MEGSQKKKLTGAAAIVMSSIIFSRLTGFIREIMVPNVLGVNEIGDAYNMAFRVTGLMYDLLVGGAIAAALIPVLTGYIAKNQEEDGWKAVGTFINLVFIAMTVTCLLGIIFAPQVVPVVAVGFRGEATELTVRLTRILFPSVAFLMLAGLTNGVLNSYQRFAAAAYAPSLYNIGSALSILFLSRISVESVAYGVMSSSLLYFLFQLAFAFRNLKYYRFKFYFKHPGFIKLFKLAIPSLISSSIVQINVIITGAFASLFERGSVTALNMADRTWQMPYGVFAQGIGIALLPTLSTSLAVGEVNNYKNVLMKGLKTVLLLSIPSAVGFIVLKEPIIRTIFKFTGKFTERDVILAGNILMLFSIALLTQSIVTIIIRGFYANNDTKTPLYVGSSSIVINCVLSYLFYRTTSLGVSGMALAYSLASAFNAAVLLIVLNKKMRGIYLDRLLVFIFKVLPASIAMGAILYFINSALPAGIESKLLQFISLVFEILVGASIYFVIVLAMKIDEAVYIYETVTGKFKRIVGKLTGRLNC